MPTIEPITDARIPAYRDAIDAVARERRFLFLLEAPPLEKSRDYVRSLIEAKGVCLVACVEDEVVGWCDIARHGPTLSHSGQLGIGVLAPHRGRGVGRALLTAAMRKAWQRDFERVELAVFADNLVAMTLYETTGFRREGLLRKAACIDDTFRDVVWMGALREESPAGCLPPEPSDDLDPQIG